MPALVIPPIWSPSYILDLLYYLKEPYENCYKKKEYSVSIVIHVRNKERTIKGCLDSVLDQNYPVKEVIAINDNSTDKTGKILDTYANKVEIIHNQTQKGKTQSILESLDRLTSELFIVVDGDTVLKKDFVDEIRTPFSDEKVAAACGTVFSLKSNFKFIERARLPEYLFYQDFRKVGQCKRKTLYTVAGCCTAYRSSIVKKYGIPARTEVEDMDLTWYLQELGYDVIYWKNAVAWTEEPQNFKELFKQLGRWYRGAWQTLLVHGRDVFKSRKKRLSTTTLLPIAEGIPFAHLWLILPYLLYTFPEWGASFFVVDTLSTSIPTLYHARKRGVLKETIKALPEYYLLKTMNACSFVYGFWKTLFQYMRKKRKWSH
jgi:biofilm PGA synthesis N-glycosyltransferase PgaC